MGKSILKVEDLYYVYGNGKTALDGINVDIYEGEKIAVLGSNGSGKSTFFLNINGVFTPEQGKIIYRDTVVNKTNLKELRKNIGIVFQDADNQIIASTVRAEVGFGPMNLKFPKDEVQKRVEEALAYMNISDFGDRPPHYLSGGEKKRVTIADIIAMKSEIVIFDEPTAVSILGIIVLIFQAILLAHGGLTTLGANTFSMAIAGPLVSYGIYKLCQKMNINKNVGIFLAASIGDLFTYCVTSIQLALAYPSQNGGVAASAAKFLAVFAPTQLPLAIIEGILSVVIVIGLETYAKSELTGIGFLRRGEN